MDELNKLVEHAAPHIQRIVIIGANMGVRIGESELLALRWSQHVDLTLGVLRIDTSRKNQNAPWREIPIRDGLLETFRQWKDTDTQAGVDFLINYKGNPVADFKKAWHATLKRAGINRRIRPYDLRHAFATQLISSGEADIGTVAELMGHSSPAMLFKTYQHVLSKQKKKAVESLPIIQTCDKPHVPNKNDLQ
ncbi:site-specific integrase [Desulfovibrio sp. OttesenSCG-928-C06]|nr:site-specific integrase [Desulfovibrio sp. OttesenSCG-928-C06]